MFVSVVIVRGVLETLAKQGFSAKDVLGTVRLPERALEDMRNMVPAADIEIIVKRAMTLSRNPALGLTLGFDAPERLLQLVGYVAMSSANLVEACEAFQRYAPLLGDGFWLKLERDPQAARLSFWFHSGLSEDLERFWSDFVAATALRMIRSFGEQRRPRHLAFRHREPAYEALYRQLFGCPVEFSQPENVLTGELTTLQLHQQHADRGMLAVFTRMADELASGARRPSLARLVSERLRLQRDLSNLDLQLLARDVGCTHRSLRRRLAAEGTSLNALIDDARRELVLTELRKPDGSIKVAADLAGYSEPSALTRAFRRWTGTTPAKYQRSLDTSGNGAEP